RRRIRPEPKRRQVQPHGSEQRGGEIASCTPDTRVFVADDREQVDQAEPDALSVIAGHAPPEVDQSAEGVVDMAAADVEVRDEQLRLDVIGVVRRLLTSAVEGNTGRT